MPSQQPRTYVNPADKKALRMYQTFHKLPVTGTMNPRTAKHMRDNNVRIETPRPRPRSSRYPPPAGSSTSLQTNI